MPDPRQAVSRVGWRGGRKTSPWTSFQPVSSSVSSWGGGGEGGEEDDNSAASPTHYLSQTLHHPLHPNCHLPSPLKYTTYIAIHHRSPGSPVKNGTSDVAKSSDWAVPQPPPSPPPPVSLSLPVCLSPVALSVCPDCQRVSGIR